MCTFKDVNKYRSITISYLSKAIKEPKNNRPDPTVAIIRASTIVNICGFENSDFFSGFVM